MYWGYGAYSLPYAWYFLLFGTKLDPMDLGPSKGQLVPFHLSWGREMGLKAPKPDPWG